MSYIRLLQSECVPKYVCWIPNPQSDDTGRQSPWEMLRSRGWSSCEWGWSPYSGGSRDTSHLFHPVRTQQGGAGYQLPDVWAINSCCLYAILECEVKWALGSITMNKTRSDGTPAELFQILKDDAMKVLHSICQQIWKTQQWPQDWKRSVFIPFPKKGQCQEMFKLPHSCTHLTR